MPPKLRARDDQVRRLQYRVHSTKTSDKFESKDSLTDFFRNLGEYESLASVNTKVTMLQAFLTSWCWVYIGHAKNWALGFGY